MKEFKTGSLHSGKGGKVVKSPKQAIAIALSEAGMAKKKGKIGKLFKKMKGTSNLEVSFADLLDKFGI